MSVKIETSTGSIRYFYGTAKEFINGDQKELHDAFNDLDMPFSVRHKITGFPTKYNFTNLTWIKVNKIIYQINGEFTASAERAWFKYNLIKKQMGPGGVTKLMVGNIDAEYTVGDQTVSVIRHVLD